MFRLFIGAIACVATCQLLTLPAHAQNAEAGRRVFTQICSNCHEVAPGRNRIGPSLFGVVGRKTGTLTDFRYSDANRRANIVWDQATLDRYLANPRGIIPGTAMTYNGLKDDPKRHDLIAYLATLH
ncbi:c-type cytochrome [Limobrevibacterium gyesilva]|uniref:Cytochrome c family protein n=1 Tax=Limobrevibacterium gyesilva TaxID=2991712 RepID=A0AA41YQ42_9PROT|nr:cytochrome c family protein [Limobrevibacterium gyesilva]MCW3474563.1 cytochrome c family protein [Limobrevibacterium gyesilva]